jgi:penicillin amidase
MMIHWVDRRGSIVERGAVMRVTLVSLVVGALAVWGYSSSDSSDGAGGTGGNGSGGTGGIAFAWPPDATVYFDEHGIFHGDCATDEDCAMALGYFHARDRFVQMDLQRRLSTGRLAGVVNKAVVESAGLLEPLINTAAGNRALYSTRDGRPAEEVLLEHTDQRTLAFLEAYSVSVNQWIDDVQNGENSATWPEEFGSPVVTYGPEDALDWAPSDTVATFFTLVGSLTVDENTQLRAAAARDDINDNGRFLDLWSLEPIKKSPVLEVGTYPPATASLAPKRTERTRPDLFRRAKGAIASLSAELSSTELLRRMFPETQIVGADIGSNNWVLGGSKTASGNTFLSNDPHLGLSQPPVWYIAHIDAKTHGTGTIHSAGVMLAGIPGAVIGQNEDIAWGATNTGLDFSDVYVEELVKNGQGEPIGVMFNGEVVEFTRVDFTMTFNDGSIETRELLFVPHHGAVRTLDAENDVAITLRWTGNDMDTDANYLLGIATATTVEEARTALENVTLLGQNWVVIDNQGSFGWFPYNRIPKRTWAENLDLDDPNEPFPWLPLAGTGEYEWDDYYDYAELPQAFNRANGWVATANSDHTGASFDGNPTNDGFAPQQTDNIDAGYRTAPIVELIETTDEHTRETNEALISDVLSMIGRDMVPAILEIANDDQTTLSTETQKIVNALSAWNYTCPTGLDGHDPAMSPLANAAEVEESSGCTAWHEVIRDIDDALAGDESTKSFPSFVTYFSIMDPSRLKAGDVCWDDVSTSEVEETKYDIIGAAFDTAGSALVADLGNDEAAWPWGRKHGLRLTSLLASLSSFFNVFNNPPGNEDFFANDGGMMTVDVANPNSQGIISSGPSTRFQCEGLQPAQCTIQLPGGQSAHVASENYDDLLSLWLDNEPIDLVFDIDEAAEQAVETFPF